MAMSVGFAVFSTDPWLHDGVAPQNVTPLPISFPPEPARDWLRTFANADLFDLKPVVFTFAMLSPITVMAVAFAFSPDIPANNEPIIFKSSFIFNLY